MENNEELGEEWTPPDCDEFIQSDYCLFCGIHISEHGKEKPRVDE